MTKNEIKFQKKVLRLIFDIKKCDVNDLVLFIALCLMRFEYLESLEDKIDDWTYLGQACALQKDLEKDNNLYEILHTK